MEDKRMSYSKEFKEEAVKRALSSKTHTQVARELGIHSHTLSRWVNEYRAFGEEGAFVGSGKLRPHDQELADMEKKIAELEEENEILKKAAAFFAANQK
jgi:transposase